jgi:internalin A
VRSGGDDVQRKGRITGKFDLDRLVQLISLGLGGTTATDAGLKELAGLTSLQFLHLDITKVTDTGLKELAGLKSLHKFGLDSTNVTDAGLKELATPGPLYHESDGLRCCGIA